MYNASGRSDATAGCPLGIEKYARSVSAAVAPSGSVTVAPSRRGWYSQPGASRAKSWNVPESSPGAKGARRTMRRVGLSSITVRAG